MSGSLYLFRHHIPNRLRNESRRAKPMRDVGVCALFSGRSLLMSTRHLLICMEAGSNGRVLGRSFLFLGLYLGALVLRAPNLPTVMVGTVVGAVCMGSAGLSIVCRVGKGPVF